MQVQDLNDLANWIKENVMNSHDSGEDTDDTSLENTLDNRTEPDAASFEKIDDVQAQKDEELTLLEFIIGIDNI